MEGQPSVIRIEKNLSHRQLQVVIASDDYELVCKEIIIKSHPKHAVVPYCMSLGVKQAQILIDDLWSCGIRPTEGMGSAGSLLATQNHLKDMQGIVDKTMNHILKIKQSDKQN